jgi:hypothetical protein
LIVLIVQEAMRQWSRVLATVLLMLISMMLVLVL